jgi:hypothetical protein
MKLYRDGLEEAIDAPGIKVSTTREGHVVEKYSVNGKPRFFVTLAKTHFCSHGATVAEAITDALWKDPSKRPSIDALTAEIKKAGKTRKISLNEFRVLTGACKEGCRVALERAKCDGSPMTAEDIKNKVSKDWGTKLITILGWDK